MSNMTAVAGLDDIDVDRLISLTAENSFHVIKGLFDRTAIRRSLERVRENLTVANDSPGATAKPEQLLTNFQKWSIGMNRPPHYVARFFRTAYNPLWCEDMYGMRENFRTLIRLRNLLSSMPLDYAIGIEPNGLYSACRLQHYPRGGGFMQEHTDHVAEANLVGSPQSRYIQLVLLLTECGPGSDYESGGAFVVDGSGKKIMTEQSAACGDVLVYDGRTIHGVDEIDLHHRIDFSAEHGRIAAFATIYRKPS